MRRGKCLVQVQVYYIKAHVSRAHDSHDRIQVRAVIVTQPACLMDNPCYLQDILIKQSNCIGVGQHKSCRVLPNRRPQLLQIHTPVFPGRYADYFITAHGRAGRVGAVG